MTLEDMAKKLEAAGYLVTAPGPMACPAPGEDGLQAWATFGTWDGPGHRPGCEKLPRTARGCYCGGDHQ